MCHPKSPNEVYAAGVEERLNDDHPAEIEPSLRTFLLGFFIPSAGVGSLLAYLCYLSRAEGRLNGRGGGKEVKCCVFNTSWVPITWAFRP